MRYSSFEPAVLWDGTRLFGNFTRSARCGIRIIPGDVEAGSPGRTG
jgi:hypothetical protein